MNPLSLIKARLAAATPGPWKAFERGSWGGCGFGVATTDNPSEQDEVKEWFVCESTLPSASNNAEFIAHAPTDIARLIKALEKCREQRDEYAFKLPIKEYLAQEKDDAELDAILKGK